MDDLISRQAAIDLVKDVCDAIMSCCGSHYDEETDDEVYDDIREIDAYLKPGAPRMSPGSGWLS